MRTYNINLFVTLRVVALMGGCIVGSAVSSQQPEELPEEPVFIPSFGHQSTSIFMPSLLQHDYLETLRKVEEKIFYGQKVSDENIEEIFDTENVLEELPEEEPIVFPYYQLSTVIYNNPYQWMVRVNGETITHRTNVGETELHVLDVRPERVTFIWYPQDVRLIKFLVNMVEEGTVGAHESLQHRLALDPKNTPVIFEEHQYVTFALEPNQVFMTEHMAIYEGGINDIIRLQAADSTPTLITPSQSNALHESDAYEADNLHESSDVPGVQMIRELLP